MEPLLAIDGLTVAFPSPDGWLPVVRDVSVALGSEEFVGLVGESGSGKSITALAVLRLLPPGAKIISGAVRLEGRDLLTLQESELRRVRGGRIGFVFQEPMTALNPVFTVGFQIAETIRAHKEATRAEARVEAERLLDLVAIPAARQRLDDYPHQLSGGQRQRVMIAMALAAGPQLLIADEPSSALDVTVQAQILELLEKLRVDLGLTILLITHDLAVVAETCSRVVVMYAGQIVEESSASRLFSHPAHPYTQGLLAAVPRLGRPAPRGELPTIPGQVPDPGDLPEGCAFLDRCSQAREECVAPGLELRRAHDEHLVRCVLYEDSAMRLT